jgi:hypothetical protein
MKEIEVWDVLFDQVEDIRSKKDCTFDQIAECIVSLVDRINELRQRVDYLYDLVPRKYKVSFPKREDSPFLGIPRRDRENPLSQEERDASKQLVKEFCAKWKEAHEN